MKNKNAAREITLSNPKRKGEIEECRSICKHFSLSIGQHSQGIFPEA
jgi:hypothetical protein